MTKDQAEELYLHEFIHIDMMAGEKNFKPCEGRVDYVDGIGQLHGTWGSLAVIPGEDEFYIV